MKLKLTESQFDRLKEKLTETNNDDTYYGVVEISVNTYEGITYKGKQVNDLSPTKLKLSFGLYIDYRSWGINSITIDNIKGPSEFETTIDYLVDNDNSESEDITLQLDWSKLITEDVSNNGVITIGDRLELFLMNDEVGNLVINGLKLLVHTS